MFIRGYRDSNDSSEHRQSMKAPRREGKERGERERERERETYLQGVQCNEQGLG